MTRLSLFAAIAGSAGLAAWAWAEAGYSWVAVAFALLGLAWIFAETRRVRIGAYLGFFLAAAGAAAGEWQSLPPVFLLLSLVLALAAWDLSDFSRRLDATAGGGVLPELEDRRRLERRHLGWLAAILLTGVGLSIFALGARAVRFKFEVAAALALLGAWGVTQLILRLRKSN
jgi:hypothetical protein